MNNQTHLFPQWANKLAAWILIALCAWIVFIVSGSMKAAAVTMFIMAALLTPVARLRTGWARANTVDSALNLDVILDASLRAFKSAVLPLTAFATVFRDIQLRGTNVVDVPYFPLVTATSKDFSQADCYVFDDAYAVDKRQITVNKRKYQTLLITGTEIARYPQLKLEQIGQMYGEKLAYDVLQDVFSVITNANFGAAAFTGVASTFDADKVTDLGVVADKVPWPKVGRSMILSPDFKGALFKDDDVRLEYAYGDAGVIRDDTLPKVGGFQFASTPAIPTNGENLAGFIAYMSAILVAFSPIAPPPNARKMMAEYRVVTDPDTDISIEYRSWGDPDCDADKHVIEANYGYGKGEANALKRIVTA